MVCVSGAALLILVGLDVGVFYQAELNGSVDGFIYCLRKGVLQDQLLSLEPFEFHHIGIVFRIFLFFNLLECLAIVHSY